MSPPQETGSINFKLAGDDKQEDVPLGDGNEGCATSELVLVGAEEYSATIRYANDEMQNF